MENTTSNQPTARSNSGIIVAVIVLLVIIGAGFLFAKNTTQKTAVNGDKMNATNAPTQTKSTTQSATKSATASASNENIQTVTMEAGSFYYKPHLITSKKGQKVKVVLHAVSMMHNFNIDELNVHSPMVKDGDTVTFEFVPDQAGQFEFYCSIGQHRQLGQVGTLTVTE